MKKIFLTILLFTTFAFSQDELAPLTYINVVNIDSVTKANKLFVSSKTWFAETYKNSKYVIQFEDKEENIIVANGSFRYFSNVFSYSAATKGYISYTLKLYFKDGKYKYEISNIIHKSDSTVSFGLITNGVECLKDIGTKGWREKVWKDLKIQIDENILSLISSHETYLKKNILNNQEKW